MMLYFKVAFRKLSCLMLVSEHLKVVILITRVGHIAIIINKTLEAEL